MATDTQLQGSVPEMPELSCMFCLCLDRVNVEDGFSQETETWDSVSEMSHAHCICSFLLKVPASVCLTVLAT